MVCPCRLFPIFDYLTLENYFDILAILRAITMKATEVHVRKSEFFSPHVEPLYANKKYDLYYPKANEPEERRNTKCLMTPDILKGLLSLDLSQIAHNVEVDGSRVLRYIKSLDEKLNSPQYEFLKEFQPDVACSCDETNRPDAKCPCPPVKKPLKFDLFENSSYAKTYKAPCQCYPELRNPCGQYSSCPAACRKDPREVRDQLWRQTDALQNKLSSSDFEFLYMAPAELGKSACNTDDFPRCGVPPVKPVDFRDKYDVIQKIQAMDGLLMSPEFGLSDSCRPTKSSTIVQTCRNEMSSSERRLCVPGCPPPLCRCGKGCPSMSGPFEKYPKVTFHVPDCPADTFNMAVPRSPEQGAQACPFSPACCPIADVCPFPVNTVYDPSAPPLPPLQGPRRCPRVTTSPTPIRDPSRPPCPLDQLKAVCQQPPGCPMVKPSSCSIGQEANCPLLTCSLGPLKTLIFDGNDECPFCHSKCCPLITPDGPGCPINISGRFCPLGNTDICALKGMPSTLFPPSTQEVKNEESCPVGELLAQCQGQQKGPILQSSSCYCSGTTSTKPRRPEECPLASMDVRPPVSTCPLANPTSQKHCPMTKMGGTNYNDSCPASKMFQCPGLEKAALAKLLNQTELHHNSSDRFKMVPSNQDKTNVLPVKLKQAANNVENSRRSPKRKSSALRQQPSKPALQQSPSAKTGKTENVMRKAVSAVYDSLPTHSSDRSKSTSGSSFFDVSLEPLPRPPWSEYENTRNSFRSRKSSSFQSKRGPKLFPSIKEDASHVKATVPDDSEGFQRVPEKQKPINCPFPEPEKCPLEVPRCPFEPPEPSCPLAKTTRCGARAICKTGISAGQIKCPVETAPCSMFPKGHCPMEDMNLCDCDFPVSPCMEPLIPKDAASAPDQYCSRLNCCMGLPLPPTKPSEEFATDTWYALAEALPGNKASKRYLQILNYPPEPEFFVSVNKERKHPAWNIIKQGEGYKQCKAVKKLLAERGPSVDVTTQFQLDDLPDDEEIQIIEQNWVNRQNAIKKILDSGSLQTEWTDIC